MKEIIKKGTPKIKKFKCKDCRTLFKTDEYRRGLGTGRLISDCPCCNRLGYVCWF